MNHIVSWTAFRSVPILFGLTVSFPMHTYTLSPSVSAPHSSSIGRSQVVQSRANLWLACISQSVFLLLMPPLLPPPLCCSVVEYYAHIEKSCSKYAWVSPCHGSECATSMCACVCVCDQFTGFRPLPIILIFVYFLSLFLHLGRSFANSTELIKHSEERNDNSQTSNRKLKRPNRCFYMVVFCFVIGTRASLISII